MRSSKLANILTVSYLALAAVTIGYELSIRIYDTGNSEFAGMLSLALTLPASIFVVLISAFALWTVPGDSNAVFVLMLGLAASLNAAIIYVIINRLSNSVRNR